MGDFPRSAMRSSRLWFALLLLGLLAFAAADEAEKEEEDDTEVAYGEEAEDGVLGESEFAQTITLFPDFPDKSFTQGEFIDVLCGFTNTGDKSFNITLIKGSLNSPFDYRMHIQNFSDYSPFTEIKKGDQGTLFYRFYPDPNLEPREYILTLLVDYIDADKEEYRTVIFNSTVEVVESQSALDTRSLFGRFLTISFLGLASFVGFQLFKRVTKKKGRGEASAKKSGGEWLDGVNKPIASSDAQRSSSGKKKKN